ncbi:MAG: hypothetical protein ACI9CF_000894 [Candidatus Omnitrophota bacterium]|jgi:hypothetical protein
MRPIMKKLLILAVIIYVVGNAYTQMKLIRKVADLEHRTSHVEGLKDKHTV